MRPGAIVLLAIVALFAVPNLPGTPSSVAGTPVAVFERPRGAHPSNLPPSLALQVPFTVTNNQTSATGYYQQLVRIDSARWSPFLNSNLSNMNFTYASNGTSVSSWIETNDSNTSTDTIVWLDLASIPGPGAVKLFLDIYNEGAFLWSEQGPAGIAPELTATYAKWDNGWRVFTFYDNFSGTSLKPTWTDPGGAAYSVNNGLNTTAGGWQIGFLNSAIVPYNASIDVRFESIGPLGPYLNVGMGTNMTNQADDFEFRYQDPNKWYSREGNSGPDNTHPIDAAVPGVWLVMTGIVPKTSFTVLNQAPSIVLNNSGVVDSCNPGCTYNYSLYVFNNGVQQNHQLHIGACCNNLQYVDVSWIDIRNLPPSGVMPSLTLPPLAPTALHVTSIGTTSVSLAWTNPAGTVTNDSIVYGTSCSSLRSSASTGGSATSGTVTSLFEGTSYCFAVRAWNATGGSVDSSTVSATTNVSSVLNLTGVPYSTSFVTLRWNNPALSTITNATATVGYTCASSFRTVSAGAVNTTTIGGLASGTAFCFGVKVWVGAKNGSFAYVNVSTGIAPGPGPGPIPEPGPTPVTCAPLPSCAIARNGTALTRRVLGLSGWEWIGIVLIASAAAMVVWTIGQRHGKR